MKERYFIHPKAYWRVIDFIETYCRHTEGELSGQLIKVPTWMKWQIRTIFGRYDRETHRRAIREVYLEIPKKNAKSTYSSCFGLYGMTADGYYDRDGKWIAELDPSVYCAAATRDQARIIFDGAANMTKKDENLFGLLRPMQYDIKHRSGTGIFKVLSSDAEGHEGIKSHMNIIDEIHIHKDGGKLYSTLKGAGASRAQPLTIIITTAGVHDPTSIGWNRHEYALKVMRDWKLDPSFHGKIYCAPQDLKDEECFEEKYWEMANPMLDISVKRSFLRDLARQAKNDPSQLNQFKRYHLNIWVSSHSQWIPGNLYDECNKLALHNNIHSGERCWIGLDIGATDDLTALARLFRKDSKFYAQMDFFCTGNKLDAVKNNSQHITYMLWNKAGWVEVAGDADTDHEYIEEKIDRYIKEYNVRNITYDPYAAFEMIKNLDKKYMSKGKEFLCPIRMNAISISPPMKKLQSLIVNQEIELYNNPVLKWMFDNVLVKIDANDNIFPNKAKAKGKIDGVVALILAVDGYLNDKYKDNEKVTEFFII